MPTDLAASGPDLLRAARAGDEDAFDQLVAPYRRELQAHCYRMLGTLHDSEDALQDTLLRAWRGLASFDGRSSLRNWLYRIATNVSLDVIGRRKRSARAADGPGLGCDRGLGLRHRTGHRVGALAPAAARRWVQAAGERRARFRRRVAAPVPEPARGTHKRSQQETLRALGDARVEAIVRSYADAFERGDVDGLVALLVEDADWSMPPDRQWYSGLASIAEFLRTRPATLCWRHLATTANGQPAVGCYRWDAEHEAFAADGIDVLTLSPEGRIAAVTASSTLGCSPASACLSGSGRSTPIPFRAAGGLYLQWV